ncbi:MAG: DNA topoisomerase [Faecalibacterium sp.]|uniref:DNA topoisomerase n=1 Tax=Faecalibacterium sp. TaxID=1971605 RepID=UPI003996A2E7
MPSSNNVRKVTSENYPTDAGREGELIFRLVYEAAGCSKPFSRLWISSMEDAAIREGFADLRPGADYDPLYQSALCRQKADWLIGINASRLFSVLYHRTLNVGRVQTPTLAMLADRDSKIVLFRKEKYHHVRLTLEGAEAVSDRIVSPEDAQAIRDTCDGQRAVCVSLVREKKAEKPPKLYDLTTLQREANRVFGYTAKQTLDYAQSLYEKKLLTYPRTDSRYLPGDMAETASVVLHLAARVPPFDACPEFFPDVAALVNDKEVSDHHALIPTLELEKADVPALPVGERNILLLVCCKLLCAAAEPFVYEAVTATFDCGGHTFTAKGKQVLSQGWRTIQEVFRSSLKEKPEDEDAVGVLPALTEGQAFEPVAASVTEHFTSPPKPYTEDTLLSAMENAGKEDMPEDAERKGLGTPATRAAIIEKLVSGGFVERKGKNLIPTKAGVNLVTVLPELLTSPKLTADWEQRLNEVAKGQASPEDFMDGIEAMAAELVRKYSHISEDGQKLFQPEKETVGLCPRCGKPVYEGKKNFACSDRACQFVMWKNDRFWTSRRKEMTPKMAADLLKKGRTSVKGMWSEKKGSTYDAVVILDDTGGKYVNFKLEFPKRKDGVHGKK